MYQIKQEFLSDYWLQRLVERTRHSKLSIIDREEGQINFECVNLMSNKELVGFLRNKLGKEIVNLRFHSWSTSHRVRTHVDNVYPNCDTAVVRLDCPKELRLIVDGESVEERMNQAIIIPENVPHSVVKGKYTRLTLVVWFSNEEL